MLFTFTGLLVSKKNMKVEIQNGISTFYFPFYPIFHHPGMVK